MFRTKTRPSPNVSVGTTYDAIFSISYFREYISTRRKVIFVYRSFNAKLSKNITPSRNVQFYSESVKIEKVLQRCATSRNETLVKLEKNNQLLIEDDEKADDVQNILLIWGFEAGSFVVVQFSSSAFIHSTKGVKWDDDTFDQKLIEKKTSNSKPAE